jgi:Receptor family ligand binding region
MKVIGAIIVSFVVAGCFGQESSTCGTGTFWSNPTSECLCVASLSADDDPTVIRLAGILDTLTYDWSTDVFAATVQVINDGWWGVLPPGNRLEYDLVHEGNDETTATRQYWNLRTANGNKPMHGIIGARTSDASIALAHVSGLEFVPQLSPASTASVLSDKEEFPSFSRLVGPTDERGEGIWIWFDVQVACCFVVPILASPLFH